MKNTMKLIAIVAFMLTAMGVSAQAKLGHIETQKLIQLMPEMAAAKKTMETTQAEVEKTLTDMQEQFNAKLQDYSASSKTMSDVIRSTKEQELQDLKQRIDRFQENAVNDLRAKQDQLMAPIIEKVTNAIKAVGKESGFLYIFDTSAGGLVFVADNAEDVLPLVKKKLGLQ